MTSTLTLIGSGQAEGLTANLTANDVWGARKLTPDERAELIAYAARPCGCPECTYQP